MDHLSQSQHPLHAESSHALDGDAQGPVKQLRRPGDNGPAIQSAANESPQVKQLKASEAAANAAVVDRKRSNETGLPEDLKSGIESLSGFSLDHVKVHYNSGKPAEVHALAYAEGSHIYVAPGQEEHLPEEAWHIVQQMQGKVQPTTHVAGHAVNDASDLEEEARQMGAKALALSSPAGAGSPATRKAGPETKVKQLKTKFTELKNDTQNTPLATLSNALSGYFAAADLAEMYILHGGKLVSPDMYDSTYKRAHSATARLEKYKRKAGERENKVIGPYGHIGWMERSILGRPDYGNIFDGGHLIERSLMEDADADIQGNLAPQEGKTFNQDLMRGWEHIPEEYHMSMDFDYSMQLQYTDDSYKRTGKDLFEAGVLPQKLHDSLSESKQKELLNLEIEFPRWIPHRWNGVIDAGVGNKFGQKIFNFGKHYARLKDSVEDAESSVVKSEDVEKPKSKLRRTNSGIIHGAISDFLKTGLNKFSVGGKQLITSSMFTGVPQLDQEKGDRGKLVENKMSTGNLSVSILRDPFSFQIFQAELEDYSPKKKQDTRSNKADGTIDTECKKLSAGYKFLREKGYFDAASGASFIKSLYLKVMDNPNFELNRKNFLEVSKAGTVAQQGKRYLLTMDENCFDKDIILKKEEEEEEEEEESTKVDVKEGEKMDGETILKLLNESEHKEEDTFESSREKKRKVRDEDEVTKAIDLDEDLGIDEFIPEDEKKELEIIEETMGEGGSNVEEEEKVHLSKKKKYDPLDVNDNKEDEKIEEETKALIPDMPPVKFSFENN